MQRPKIVRTISLLVIGVEAEGYFAGGREVSARTGGRAPREET